MTMEGVHFIFAWTTQNNVRIDPSVIKIIINLRSQNMVGISTNTEECTDKSIIHLTVS